MDSRDIIAQWRRDIAAADNADDGAASRLRGDFSAAAEVDARYRPTSEHDELDPRTGD